MCWLLTSFSLKFASATVLSSAKILPAARSTQSAQRASTVKQERLLTREDDLLVLDRVTMLRLDLLLEVEHLQTAKRARGHSRAVKHSRQRLRIEPTGAWAGTLTVSVGSASIVNCFSVGLEKMSEEGDERGGAGQSTGSGWRTEGDARTLERLERDLDHGACCVSGWWAVRG